jgi:hypothetical protein
MKEEMMAVVFGCFRLTMGFAKGLKSIIEK